MLSTEKFDMNHIYTRKKFKHYSDFMAYSVMFFLSWALRSFDEHCVASVCRRISRVCICSYLYSFQFICPSLYVSSFLHGPYVLIKLIWIQWLVLFH